MKIESNPPETDGAPQVPIPTTKPARAKPVDRKKSDGLTVPEYSLPMLTDAEQDVIWGQMENLGVSKRLKKEFFKAKRDFAQMLSLNITPEIIGVNLVETAEILQQEIRNAARAAESAVKLSDQLNALMAITLASRALSDLSVKMVRMYQPKSVPQIEPVGGNKAKAPSNDIPFVVANNIQINAAKGDKFDVGGTRQPPS